LNMSRTATPRFTADAKELMSVFAGDSSRRRS
jgi:hypothetical protein